MNYKHKITTLIITACIGINGAFAQTLKDVFTNSETPVFYLGIDFTQTRLIDDAAANETDIRDRQFTGINDVIVNEPKKYDLAGAFHKSEIDHDLGYVAKKNESANAEAIKSTNTGDFHRFTESDVAKVVSGYSFGDKSGIGLLFVTEALSKSKKAAAVWVTLIDMKSRKVLMTDRVEGSVSRFGGFTFRNYWASAFKDVIDTIEKKKYSEWKSKYGS
ncbi:hypothetical protein [Parafilimonas sp.]|uniref:hypothetical protein n=1 Tax=Parafilimonas sp. TaxID=1969739 RepID=UPI0039E6D942